MSAAGINVRLAVFLALRSLRFHKVISLVTALGVAIGMTVIGAILVVDHNTAIAEARKQAQTPQVQDRSQDRVRIRNLAHIERVEFDRHHPDVSATTGLVAVPNQSEPVEAVQAGTRNRERIGEEDYQAMRIAVRMTSLFAFAIGAVIVFYTMRYGVAAREREFALLITVGESRATLMFGVLLEAGLMGLVGSVLGAVAAIFSGRWLLAWGITTTGRSVVGAFEVPIAELSVFTLLGVLIALTGTIAPLNGLRRLGVGSVLQPRFVAEQGDDEVRETVSARGGFIWLLPALLLAAYLLLRPFLQGWLSVVGFFLFEALFAGLFALVLLWWTRPLLIAVIGAVERLFRPLWPLVSRLTGRRMRLSSRRYVFSISGLVLVFSLLVALHGITASLKAEIAQWAEAALLPNQFFEYAPRAEGRFEDRDVVDLQRMGVAFMRLSPRVESLLPYRLINHHDFNLLRRLHGLPPFGPGQVILSNTLAERFSLRVGDVVRIIANGIEHRFDVVEIGDRWGYYPQDGQYITVRSYALFSDNNALFRDNLDRFVGWFGVARSLDEQRLLMTQDQAAPLLPYYRPSHHSVGLTVAQMFEIDRDFLIFDYILAMTVLLAVVGVINSMLVQLRSRAREFALYKVVGMDNRQIGGLLMMEGLITGVVSAVLAVCLGLALGAISVEFLDGFTLFSLNFVVSIRVIAGTLLAVPILSMLAALYPAHSAAKLSSSESLHYES
ncbi:MAG: ABC transporter permease [Gammaproteobacteria bacterium]|nr:ABC transporter permease [Gammaproteobacteria bacterium]MCP5136981.1 ABC transporter permease [Gammaproteobacteria bacterium]